MDTVGYTCSDGYALCTDCEDGNTIDPGNESGYVQAIFDTDEWDYQPTCDVCHTKLDVVVIEQ